MNYKLIAEFISKDHPTAINLLDVKGSFAHWVRSNTDWIKDNANIKDKRPLLDRLDHLRDEGVKISPEKVAQLKDRLLKARNNFDMYSVFYLAAVSYDKLDTSIKTKRIVHESLDIAPSIIDKFNDALKSGNLNPNSVDKIRGEFYDLLYSVDYIFGEINQSQNHMKLKQAFFVALKEGIKQITGRE